MSIVAKLTFRTLVALLLAGTLLPPAARAQAQPSSTLSALFDRIPRIPVSLQDADRLVDTDRQIPAITALKVDLGAHAEAVEKIYGAADARIRNRIGGGTSADTMMQAADRVGAVAGIDMARMQSDPAYAAQMQARMKAMSPQELMAMSSAMQRGMGLRGSVAVYDPPQVKAAADAGRHLMQPDQQAQRLAAYQHRWTTVERKVAALHATYAARFPKPQLICDGEGGGRPECQAERARLVAAMMPLLLARDADVLRVEAAALEDERSALAAQVRSADQHLQAARYGAASQELGHPAAIHLLDRFTVEDMLAFASRLEDVARRAALVTHCGPKILDDSTACYRAR